MYNFGTISSVGLICVQNCKLLTSDIAMILDRLDFRSPTCMDVYSLLAFIATRDISLDHRLRVLTSNLLSLVEHDSFDMDAMRLRFYFHFIGTMLPSTSIYLCLNSLLTLACGVKVDSVHSKFVYASTCDCLELALVHFRTSPSMEGLEAIVCQSWVSLSSSEHCSSSPLLQQLQHCIFLFLTDKQRIQSWSTYCCLKSLGITHVLHFAFSNQNANSGECLLSAIISTDPLDIAPILADKLQSSRMFWESAVNGVLDASLLPAVKFSNDSFARVTLQLLQERVSIANEKTRLMADDALGSMASLFLEVIDTIPENLSAALASLLSQCLRERSKAKLFPLQISTADDVLHLALKLCKRALEGNNCFYSDLLAIIISLHSNEVVCFFSYVAKEERESKSLSSVADCLALRTAFLVDFVAEATVVAVEKIATMVILDDFQNLFQTCIQHGIGIPRRGYEKLHKSLMLLAHQLLPVLSKQMSPISFAFEMITSHSQFALTLSNSHTSADVCELLIASLQYYEGTLKFDAFLWNSFISMYNVSLSVVDTLLRRILCLYSRASLPVRIPRLNPLHFFNKCNSY
jgi:hypothetical protein